MRNINFEEAPKKVKDFIAEVCRSEDEEYLSKQFDEAFEGVFLTLHQWAEEHHLRDIDEIEEFLFGIGENLDPVFYDYVEVDGRFWCFFWS